jgi:16S rRNA processing protein RimM
MTDKKVILGRLGATHGVRGWLKVQSFTQPPSNLFDHNQWLVFFDGAWQSRTVEFYQKGDKHARVKLVGIDSPEEASAYTLSDVAVLTTDLPPLESSEHYWHDLIGARVQTLSGEDLGTVSEMMETGANDVLVIINGHEKHLVPYLDHVIVSLSQGLLVVDWDVNY